MPTKQQLQDKVDIQEKDLLRMSTEIVTKRDLIDTQRTGLREAYGREEDLKGMLAQAEEECTGLRNQCTELARAHALATARADVLQEIIVKIFGEISHGKSS